MMTNFLLLSSVLVNNLSRLCVEEGEEEAAAAEPVDALVFLLSFLPPQQSFLLLLMLLMLLLDPCSCPLVLYDKTDVTAALIAVLVLVVEEEAVLVLSSPWS